MRLLCRAVVTGFKENVYHPIGLEMHMFVTSVDGVDVGEQEFDDIVEAIIGAPIPIRIQFCSYIAPPAVKPESKVVATVLNEVGVECPILEVLFYTPSIGLNLAASQSGDNAKVTGFKEGTAHSHPALVAHPSPPPLALPFPSP